MDWWALFRTVALLHLLSMSSSEQSEVQSTVSDSVDETGAFMEAVGIVTRACDQSPPTSTSGTGKWEKPLCKEKAGCNKPLNCFDYSETNLTDPLRITPYELEHILENPSITNTCAIVMFYAPWCPFSVDFAPQFNAMGRSYKELPVIAVDIAAEYDLYKYLMAYIPLVSFYYRGRVIYRFKATESYEELLEQVTTMTGFQPTRVALSYSENEYPVPTEREDGDSVYLVISTCWVILVVVVYVCRLKTVSECIFRIASRFYRTKSD